MLAPALKQERIVIATPEQSIDVTLFWHHATVHSSALQQLNYALTRGERGVEPVKMYLRAFWQYLSLSTRLISPAINVNRDDGVD